MKVVRNKGVAGIDEMIVEEMLSYLKENKGELLERLKEGKYKSKAELEE